MKTATQLRNEEFLRRCIGIFDKDHQEGRISTLPDIIARATAMQPHSHYLSYDTASRRLHRIMRNGLENEIKEDLAREMWAEILEQVKTCMSSTPPKSFDKALSFVLNFCRPSRFYISYDTAKRIISPNRALYLYRTRC